MDDNHSGDDGGEQRRTDRKVLVLTAIVMVIAAAVGIGLARYGSELPIIGPIFGESDATPMSEVGFRGIRVSKTSPRTPMTPSALSWKLSDSRKYASSDHSAASRAAMRVSGS